MHYWQKLEEDPELRVIDLYIWLDLPWRSGSW
jgi:hypothetical protein